VAKDPFDDMEVLREALAYVRDDPERFQRAVETHVRLSLYALFWALLIFVPLGVAASRSDRLGPSLAGAVAALRVIPSLTILFLMVAFVDLGFRPALIALTVLAGPPLIVNVDAGLRGVPAAVLENARGLGMNPVQVFSRVQLPLALPVIIAGVRSATVEIVASAALASFVGVRTLGNFIVQGVTTGNNAVLLVGAISVTLLALLAEVLLGLVERLLTPPPA
jgi:osmoprotectant transport system permease protein